MASILLAMILIFVFVPINFISIDVAFIPLMAVIIACQVEGKKLGVFTATMFGLASLAAAFLRPNILSPIFYNPLVSILPRIIIGFTCYFSYKGMQKLIHYILKKRAAKDYGSKEKARIDRISMFTSSTVSSMVAVITNTALVVAMIVLFNYGKAFEGVVDGESMSVTINKSWVFFVLGVNFLVELAVCAIITPPIVCALRIALRKKESGYWLIAEPDSENEAIS